MQSPVLVIGGPTASGKSGLALSIAENLKGVVINADSMQVYEGLPILTALPSADDMRRAPHRLYATMKPDETCSAAIWRDLALEEINRAHAEKKLPIIVGGTGFYIKALLKGLSPIPEVPHEFRERISKLQKEMGNPAFHADLEKRDPIMAGKLHPFNTQRLIRAWEVLEATGKSLAHWQDIPVVPPPEHLKFKTVVLLPPREKLYDTCNARFDVMMQAGALDEVNAFRARGLKDVSIANALGYRELCDYIDGNITLEAAATAAKTSTRHYAKRQVTWFRHQIKADLTLAAPDTLAVIKALDF